MRKGKRKHVTNFSINKHCTKTIFSFSKCSEKMVVPKKLHWNMIFLLLLGKMIFLFPENIILFFRQKMKDDVSQKIYENMIFSSNVLKRSFFQKNSTEIWYFLLYYLERWYFFFPKIWSYSLDGKWKMIFLKKIHGNMIFSSNVLKRWSFQKNCTGIWSFLYHEERWHFFFPKIWYFFTDGKWKMIFLKKYMEIWCFLYICINVTNMILPFCKKNQRWSSPEKIHLKVIDILDRILERVSTVLYTFMETFIDIFIYCFPAKKMSKLNI